jgi:predicted TIM-barrel fold metal-dependent hydrolase
MAASTVEGAMRRRDFLVGGMAYPAALACCKPAMASPLPQKIVDVHCHIFNSQDLPMVDFIDKSLVRNAPNEAKISPYIPLIDVMLKDIATRLRDSTGDENKYLDSIDVEGHKARSQRDIEKSELKFVTRLFKQWNGHGALPFGQIKLTLEVIGSYFPIIAFGFLRRELIPGTYTGPKAFSIGNALDNSDDAFTLGPEFDPDYLANQLYDPAVPKGAISYSIKWAVIFARYRRELAEELNRVNHNRAVLVTPALVDFTKWLDASSDKMTTIADQVALMGRLSHEKRQDQPHIHGFVAFDPLRQAIHDKLGGTSDASPLAIIDKAITQDGFVGIKLYPPMGFRATSNAAAGNDFPCWVRFGSGSPGYGEKCVNPKNTADGLGDAPGQILDDVLARLYAWCVAKNVPIMAHTNNSNEAGPGYGTRASPDYWNLVLQQQQFRTLRINMAHFGGFNEAFKTGSLSTSALSQTWEWKIGRMFAANPNAMIFSDISYFSEVLDPKSKQRQQTLLAMRQFLKEFPISDRLLMYGTDWSMLGHDPSFGSRPQPLPDLVAEFMADAGYSSQDQLDNIFYRNAARFLGLLPSDRANGTRGRLETFYGSPANSAWLQMFDQVT